MKFVSRRVAPFAILAFAVLMAILFAAETYCRRNHPSPEPKNDSEKTLHTHWMSPFTMYSRFKYPEPKPDIEEGTLRVFVTGGSTVERSVPSIPELMQGEFKNRGQKDVRVFNYGVEGQKSTQELIHLAMHIAKLEPDLIVMYNGASDIIQPIAAEPRPGYPYNFYELENNPVFRPVSSYPWLPLILYGSNLARHKFYNYFARHLGDYARVDDLRRETGYDTDAWRERIADIYVNNLEKSQKLSHAFGARFVCLLQPLVYYKEPLSSDEASIVPFNFSQQPVSDYFGTVSNHALATRQKILNRLARHKQRETIDFVDLSDAFDERRETVFLTYMYLTPEGNQQIAERIVERILPWVEQARKDRTSGHLVRAEKR